MFQHKTISILLALPILTITFLVTPTAFAQSEESLPSSDNVQIYPYERTFVITAYYSPIEGQTRYIRGSLAADKKLNGNGTNGADGTPVYPGMIAAPKNIPFGTKMNIPGIGMVAVHDRGGAILAANSHGNQYDRLDIWMGSGDAGLNRALRWGRRTVKVVVYGLDDSIAENVDLSSISDTTTITNASTPIAKSQDYSYGDRDVQIKVIKEQLSSLHYFHGTIDESFDQALYQAILDFQLQNNIVDNENEFGAGYFGPQTRQALKSAVQNQDGKNIIASIPTANAEDSLDNYAESVLLAGNGLTFLKQDLQLGDSGQSVIELQTELAKLNFFGLEPTGYYGEVTSHAVFKFQQSQGIVAVKSDLGAGILGPDTRTMLSKFVNKRIETRKIIALKPEETDLLAKK